MTTPIECYNAIKYARQFLSDLMDPKKWPRVPRAVRKEAYWRLRHFPSSFEMEMAQANSPELFGEAEQKEKSA